MMILGVDPGTTETAYALVNDNYEVQEAGKINNESFRGYLYHANHLGVQHVVVEGIQAYGMAVGKEVFLTCYQIGRYMEICETTGYGCTIYNRPEYSKAICGVQKVNDSVLRQALILRFGGDRKGEPLHLLKGSTDKRSAYAIAVYHLDRMKQSQAVNF